MNGNKLFAISILSGVLTSIAFGASFHATNQQSAVLMGQAGAGAGVSTDPSVQFYNPAGMAFVKKPELGISAIAVAANVQFDPTKATGFDGRPINGTTQDPGGLNVLPSFFYIQPINSKLTFGLGSEIPYGLETSYPNNSIARYFALESKLIDINLNPSFAYRPVHDFSFGGGLIFNYAYAELSQMIDSAGILHNAAAPNALLMNKASGTALAWDAGIELKPTDATALGLAYHSEIRQDLFGNATISGDTTTLQQLMTFAGLQDASLTSTLNLPGYTAFSASHKMNSKWTVMTDVDYFNWSELQNITINYATDTSIPMQPAMLPFNYRDTWMVSVGQSYQIRSNLLFRMGLAWDESPVSNENFRSPRIPDSNRYVAAVGATYDINKRSDLNFGYAHIFFANGSSVNTLGSQTFDANYSVNANFVGLQYNLRFS